MTRAALLASADMSLVEDLEYHITATGLVWIDGSWYTIEQVDPELAEREQQAALARYRAMCKRPRSAAAWRALATRLANCMQGPANLALLPLGSDRRRHLLVHCQDANDRAALSKRLGRAV